MIYFFPTGSSVQRLFVKSQEEPDLEQNWLCLKTSNLVDMGCIVPSHESTRESCNGYLDIYADR